MRKIVRSYPTVRSYPRLPVRCSSHLSAVTSAVFMFGNPSYDYTNWEIFPSLSSETKFYIVRYKSAMLADDMRLTYIRLHENMRLPWKMKNDDKNPQHHFDRIPHHTEHWASFLLEAKNRPAEWNISYIFPHGLL